MATKNISEFGLNMVASRSVILQDEDVDKLDEHFDGNAPKFHIYIIGSRPRITFDPAKFEFTPESIHGAFVVHRAAERIAIPFKCPHPPQGRVDRLESAWPHTTFTFLLGDHEVLTGKTALFAAGFPPLREHIDLEVLYVGQSFGTAGEREAADRLQSHATLQQILGEASRLQPDREVWLTLFQFEELVIAAFDGRLGSTDADIEADDGRIDRICSGCVSEQQKINFTEAALIRYFEPRFNKTFRTNFPSPLHKSYAECYALDLNMVAVELGTEELYLRLYSQAKARQWIHFATFPLHDQNERRYMLDLLKPDADAT